MLLEEICGLPAIIGKKTVIAFLLEQTRKQDVQKNRFHVVDAMLSDDWFLYHFDLSQIQNLFKQGARNKSQKQRYLL